MKMNFATKSIVGSRVRQEDYLSAEIIADGCIIAAVADGMGGEVDGHIASAITIHSFLKTFRELFFQKNSKKTPSEILINSVLTANEDLLEYQEEKSLPEGMGSTIIAAFIHDNSLYWISVGDSVLFLYRNNVLLKLNQDHSYGAYLDKLVLEGEITNVEAENSPDRSALISCLSGDDIDEIDCPENGFKIAQNDIFILASDGICSLDLHEIHLAIKRHSFETKHNDRSSEICAEIIKAIEKKEFKHQDNVSVLVVVVS